MALTERIRERDIVEILQDQRDAAAGTQGTVLLDWSDGSYEVSTSERYVPVTVLATNMALLARPVPPARRGH